MVTSTSIPEASSISLSVPSVNVGNSIVVNIARTNSNFTHTVEFYIDSYYYQKYTDVSTAQALIVPDIWYTAMPSSTSCTAYCRVTTYDGSTQIGNPATKAFTVNVPSNIVPSVGAITFDPVDITTTDGVSRNVLVKDKNRLTISVSGCSAGIGSSIQSYTFSGVGISTTTTNTSVTSAGVISTSGTLTYTVKVTDTRGRTASKIQKITCYDYYSPSFASFKAYRANANGVADSAGTYVKCDYVASYAGINNTNSVKVDILCGADNHAYRAEGSGGTALFNVGNNDTAYRVYAIITDIYGGSAESATINVPAASRVFNITKDGTGIAIGKMAESNNLLDCRWPIRSDDPGKTMKNLSYRGSNLISAPALDTVSRWGEQNNLATTFYNISGALHDQPSQYGFLLNLTTGSAETHQLWATQPNGNLAHRGGNGDGWSGSWKIVLDSSNYTNYVTTPSDYVVAQGTSGNFTYRKWNSGVSEAWYYEQLGTVALTSAVVSGVYINSSYSSKSVTLPSGLFVSGTIPIATSNIYSSGYTNCRVASCTSSTVVYRIWSPYSTTVDGCRVSIHITGRWK